MLAHVRVHCVCLQHLNDLCSTCTCKSQLPTLLLFSISSSPPHPPPSPSLSPSLPLHCLRSWTWWGILMYLTKKRKLPLHLHPSLLPSPHQANGTGSTLITCFCFYCFSPSITPSCSPVPRKLPLSYFLPPTSHPPPCILLPFLSLPPSLSVYLFPPSSFSMQG